MNDQNLKAAAQSINDVHALIRGRAQTGIAAF